MKNGCDCCVIIFIFIGSVRALASVLIACVWVRALHTHVLASSSELCSECICAYCSQTLVSNVCPCCSFVQRRDRACVCVCVFECVLLCVCVCVLFSCLGAAPEVDTSPVLSPTFLSFASVWLLCTCIFLSLRVYPAVRTRPLSISW